MTILELFQFSNSQCCHQRPCFKLRRLCLRRGFRLRPDPVGEAYELPSMHSRMERGYSFPASHPQCPFLKNTPMSRIMLIIKHRQTTKAVNSYHMTMVVGRARQQTLSLAKLQGKVFPPVLHYMHRPDCNCVKRQTVP